MVAHPPERLDTPEPSDALHVGLGPLTTAAADAAASRPVRPRVTIGVPVYNGERYLERALESLLAQSYRDLEIVISDNGSTDSTPAIIARFAERDARIRHTRTDKNRGLVWNHRRVLALAKGDYFMFAPHDDWFAPDYVARAVEALDADPSVAWAHAVTILVDEDGRELGRELARQRLDDPSPSTRFWDVLVVQGGINWYGMTRTALMRRIAPYRPLPRGERIVLAELALHGPFALLEGDLYFRRIHEGQLTALRVDRRAEAAALDPRRSKGLRGTVFVLVAEYVLAYFEAVVRAPVSLREKVLGLGRVARWLLAKVPGFALRDERAQKLDIRLVGDRALPTGRESVGY